LNIVDDFLTPTYANMIEQQLQSPQQEWYFKGSGSGDLYTHDEIYQYGFSFLLHSSDEGGYTNTPLSILMRPFLAQLESHVEKNLARARCDMTVANGVKVLHPPHVDLFGEKHTTAIYYVSDSDGDTVVYNETDESEEYTVMKTITPKKNRLCVFDGSHYHTGHSPMKHKNRILINANFI
jgi:hypothetical protein